MVVSNNSTHTAPELSAELRRAGLDVPDGRLVLAGVTAIDKLARAHAGARILLLGSESLRRQAGRVGLHLVDDRCDVVLLARDAAFTYEKLARAANEVRRGAHLVVTNPDLSHPGRDGAVVPETGSLLRALLACASPRSVQFVGKPEPRLFEEAMRRLNATPRDCIVIGDNPDTDGAGARRLGLPCVLVHGRLGPDLRDVAAIARGLCGRSPVGRHSHHVAE